MKLSIAVSVCAAAGSIACSHDSRSRGAYDASRSEAAPPRVAPIPMDNPPMPLRAPGASTEPPLTPASGVATPRTRPAPLVPNDGVNQFSGPADEDSIRQIRELLAADRSLSPSARNVTIVARDGIITLRGQVNTAQERAAIERAARRGGGVIEVRNELAVME
jgi:hypothetical protein